MPKFHKFEQTSDDEPVYVNPAMVCAARTDHHASGVILFLGKEHKLTVKETLAGVITALEDA